MEPLSLSSNAANQLIRLFCGLLASFLLLSIGLLCFLHINETVDFKEGQIYSRTPPAVLRTPTDVRVQRVLVHEGDQVHRGDTLFLLENKRLQYDYKTTQHDVAALAYKLQVAKKLLVYLHERQQTLGQRRLIQQQLYAADRDQNERDIRALAADASYDEQQSAISRSRYRADSLLYAHQAVSRVDEAESRSRTLSKRKETLDTWALHDEKRGRRASLLQTFRRQSVDLEVELNSLNQDIQRQQRALLDLRDELESKRNSAAVLADEANQLVVRAPVDGNVLDLYNARQTTELLPRNEPLAVIAPKQEQFYAKVILPERELAYVRLNQEVNLKLNAYYYYQYGAVQGRVQFISPANVNDQFFTIVRLANQPRFPLKSGYKLQGEIITAQYTLLRYSIKKLFDKLDTYHEA